MDDKTNIAEFFGEDDDSSTGGVDSTAVSVVPAKKMRKRYGPPWTFAGENRLEFFSKQLWLKNSMKPTMELQKKI